MRLLLLTSVLILFNLTQIYSQLKDSCCQNYSVNSYLKQGDLSASLTAGYSFKSKVPSFGLNIDYGVHQLKAGIISIGVSGRFNSSKEDLINTGSELKTRNITAGITGKLNFNRLESRSIIPYAGVLLGYNNTVTEYSVNNIDEKYFPDTKKHSFYILGQAGAYFFINKNFAFNINFSSGNIEKGLFEGGFTIKL